MNMYMCIHVYIRCILPQYIVLHVYIHIHIHIYTELHTVFLAWKFNLNN